MSIHREKIFEIKGKGILKNEPLEIPVNFTCYQYFDGVIEGTMELSEEDKFRYLQVFFANDEFNLLSAEIENTKINIEKLIITHKSIPVLHDIRFKPNFLKLKTREITSKSNKLCKFFVSNLKSLHTFFDSDIGNVTFEAFKNEKEIWQDIENYDRSGITGFIQIILDDKIKLDSIDDYKLLLYEKIKKILLLTSLAQGIYIDWASFELFEQINDTNYEIVYSERKTIRNYYASRHEIIHYFELSDYLKIGYSNYTQKLDDDQGLNLAIEWYLESLNQGILESQYMKLFTVLELLIFRFIFLIKREYILKEEEFKKIKTQLLQKEMSEVLKILKIDREIRASLYANLDCVNRYKFETNLISFLNHYKTGFSDLIDNPRILIRIRDKITHRGFIEIEFEELFDAYNKLLTLIQRIFLSMLNYQGSYYNWMKKNFEQFNPNPNNDLFINVT